ncbi:MAG: late competence development ComFB family protein, partial [Oscillospiraceae bacterium]|nr:late competence development ComFB family protein [Oscillospiraceae bacterium]
MPNNSKKTKLNIEDVHEIGTTDSQNEEHQSTVRGNSHEARSQGDAMHKGAPLHKRQTRKNSPVKDPDEASMVSKASNSSDIRDELFSIRDVPDGIPFEKRGDDIMADVLNSANNAGARLETIEDVRASIRIDEAKRAEKIAHVYQLLGSGNQILNLSESLAIEIMPSIIEKLGVCKCSICASNILALALNMLPPRYTTTTAGK